ncbi:MAG TPA: MmgE/PrpD family protein [Burkholderiales bacterium]|nr:MmgE/PrpD family protein [Burkholderiales bacterium]
MGNHTLTMARRFARWGAGLKYEDLPPEVVDKIKALMLHALTSIHLGWSSPYVKEVIRLARAEEGKPDGATILGDGGKVSRVGAAFVNNEILHASGLVDSYRMRTHPGPVLIPVALANAELEQRSGRDVITALAAGYEFLCRLSYDFTLTTSTRGFQPSSVFCTMGAAMVSGKLLGLDEEGLMRTISLAANYASGLVESSWQGDRQAARSGVFAALMARTGHLKAAERALDGNLGFYKAFTGSNTGKLEYAFTGPLEVDPASITADLGTRYRLSTVMFRMFGVAAYNDPVIYLLREMRQQHNIRPEDVAELAVAMNWHETMYPSVASPAHPEWNRPRVGSTHYYAAHVLVNGDYPVVGGRTFGPTGRRLAEDTKVLDFMNDHAKLVQERDRPMFSPGAVVKMKNGATFTGNYPYERLEWNFEQLVARLQDCLPGYSPGKAGFDALVETMRGADGLTSVERIFEVTKA